MFVMRGKGALQNHLISLRKGKKDHKHMHTHRERKRDDNKTLCAKQIYILKENISEKSTDMGDAFYFY